MIGCVSENVNVPQWGELCKWEHSYQAFIITDTIQVCSITNKIKYKHRVLFTEDDNHRVIFTMDDRITKCITNKD